METVYNRNDQLELTSMVDTTIEHDEKMDETTVHVRESASVYTPLTRPASPDNTSTSSSESWKKSGQGHVDEKNGVENEREVWSHKAEFLLSLIGYAVGMGNVWRFPYLTQKNGGGAFIIPYAVMMIIEGIPLFYLELAIGQRLRKGAYGCWNEVSPYLGGIGLASATASLNCTLYYNTIIAWCLLYLAQSFQNPLPWAHCPTVTQGNTTIVNEECQKSGATSYFWYRETLQISPDVESTPGFNFKLAAALLVAWTVVFLCMIKGIKSSGKVVYVTATFPYIVLLIFFFRGVTLPGFDKGLEYLFVPEALPGFLSVLTTVHCKGLTAFPHATAWSRLADPAVWMDAATQIFYSFGMGFGCLIALSSYNPVRSNFARDALFVSLVDFFTSIFAATVVFSILGYKANVAYEECMSQQMVNSSLQTGVVSGNTTCVFKEFLEGSVSGRGLVFIVFTEAINQFPVPQVWSVLFFLMLLTLGLDSVFCWLEGAMTSFNDMKMFRKWKKELKFGILCLGSFLMSLVFATRTGPYVFDLYDSFSLNIPLLIVSFLECLAISYVYGLKRFSDDIELMLGSRPSYFWMICWRYVGPIAMLLIFVASVVDTARNGSVYGAWDSLTGSTISVQWPWWCMVLATMLILMSVIWIPGVAACRYFKLVKWTKESPAFFPTEQLRHEHGIKYRESTWFEKRILGFKGSVYY